MGIAYDEAASGGFEGQLVGQAGKKRVGNTQASRQGAKGTLLNGVHCSSMSSHRINSMVYPGSIKALFGDFG